MLLDQCIPIAGTSVLLVLLIKSRTPSSKKSLTIVQGIFYVIITLSLQFSVKEILLPYIQDTPNIASAPIDAPQTIILQEFDQISNLPYKMGMVLQNKDICFIFGKIAQQNPNSYLIQNVFFSSSQPSPIALFAEYAKIINNQIILYKATVFSPSNGILTRQTDLTKNYALPLPFDIKSLFKLWNTTDPKEINISFIIANNTYLKPFILPIVLAISQYILGFITLLLICSIAIALKDSLSFKGFNIIGSLLVIICSYPFTLLIYYYLLLITQSTIYYIIKI